MIHALASLLVLLAPVLFLVAIPAFTVALRTKRARCFGVFGWLLLLGCAYAAITDKPHGRAFDSIDHGLLTGIPTTLVLLTSIYTLILSTCLLCHIASSKS